MSSWRSLVAEPSTCFPDLNIRLIDSSRLLRTVVVDVSEKESRDTAFSVTFGPRFLMPCLMKLLLCSVASSSGMFVPILPALLTERFHVNRSESLWDRIEWTRKNWYKHSSAYFVLCVPVLPHYPRPIPFFNCIKEIEEKKSICQQSTVIVKYIILWFWFTLGRIRGWWGEVIYLIFHLNWRVMC